MQLLILDGNPLFIDLSGKGDYVPTIAALAKAPTLLPVLQCRHAAVSKFVLRGADLFAAGVALDDASLPAFRKGTLLAVAVPGNPIPFAVGTADMDSEDAKALGAGKLLSIGKPGRQLTGIGADQHDLYSPLSLIPIV